MIEGVNWMAVLVSAALSMGLGFLWYSPVLFGKRWTTLMGLTEKKLKDRQQKMGVRYGAVFLSTLVMTTVLAVTVNVLGILDAYSGARLGFVAWLGFVATSGLNDVLFGGKELELYAIETGYVLVYLIMAGVLLAGWI